MTAIPLNFRRHGRMKTRWHFHWPHISLFAARPREPKPEPVEEIKFGIGPVITFAQDSEPSNSWTLWG